MKFLFLFPLSLSPSPPFLTPVFLLSCFYHVFAPTLLSIQFYLNLNIIYSLASLSFASPIFFSSCSPSLYSSSPPFQCLMFLCLLTCILLYPLLYFRHFFLMFIVQSFVYSTLRLHHFFSSFNFPYLFFQDYFMFLFLSI